MGKFSKKAQKKGYDSKIDNVGFAEHLEEVFDEVFEEEGNVLPCIISGIVDTGSQTSWTEYPWEDSQRQHDLLAKDFGCEVDEENGLFRIPSKAETVVFFVDFPQIMVNYGRFFGGGGVVEDGEKFSYGEDDYKPFRTLLAGEWDRVATPTPVVAPFGAKSRIAKLAKATGVVKKGLPPDDFDIGDLLGEWIMMTVEGTRSGDDGEYYNVKVKTPTAKPKSVPTPDYDLEPFGIMFSGDNDPEDLKMIASKKVILNLLEQADGWEDSGLKAEIDTLKESRSNSNGSSDEEKPAKKPAPKKVTPKAKTPTQKVEEEADEDDDDNDDDCPFG